MAISSSDLSEEQLRGIQTFVEWYQKGRKEGFEKGKHTFKLGGPAGSGKSTLALFALEAAGINVHSSKVMKVAFTGKAAKVMRDKGLAGAMTIHKAIYIPLDEAGDQVKELRSRLLKLRGSLGVATPEERVVIASEIEAVSTDIKALQEQTSDETQWVLNHFCQLADADLILCDESSMVGGKIQLDLESFGVPIIYLGDPFQLQPIADPRYPMGSVFFDIKGKVVPVNFQLTEIHRQAEGSPILRYSRALRENRVAELNFTGKATGDSGVLVRVPKSRITIEHLAKAGQVICGYNKTRHAINAQIREFLGAEDVYPLENDKLIILKNNSDLNLINGMTGIALDTYTDFDSRSNSFYVSTELDDGRAMNVPMLVPYFQAPGDDQAIYDCPGWARKKFAHVDYGYAISCNKSQGSEYQSGLVLDEAFGQSPEDLRRWRYTAITRFRESAILAF